MTHPDGCDCRTCRLWKALQSRNPKGPALAPTAAQLERHLKRFGPDQVAETAAEHGLNVKVARPKATRRAGGPSLKARVAALVAEGHGVDVIAELENLSPSRARRLIEEVSQ